MNNTKKSYLLRRKPLGQSEDNTITKKPKLNKECVEDIKVNNQNEQLSIADHVDKLNEDVHPIISTGKELIDLIYFLSFGIYGTFK